MCEIASFPGAHLDKEEGGGGRGTFRRRRRVGGFPGVNLDEEELRANEVNIRWEGRISQ